MSIETFGKYVSYLRTDRDFSLREFAEKIDHRIIFVQLRTSGGQIQI